MTADYSKRSKGKLDRAMGVFIFAPSNIASSNLIVTPPFDDLSAYTIDSIIWPTDLARENFFLNLWPKNYNTWHTTEAMSMSGTLIATKNRSSALNEQNWIEILYRTEWKNIRWSNQKCNRSSSFKSAGESDQFHFIRDTSMAKISKSLLQTLLVSSASASAVQRLKLVTLLMPKQ